jgi:hypothetical protein
MANDRDRLHLLAVAQLSEALLRAGWDGPCSEQVAALLDTRDVSNAGQAHCFAMLDDLEARLGLDVAACRATVEQLHGISADDSYHIHQRG